MVPANIGGVAILLLIVIPGLHYELLRERQRSGRADSTFVEITRVLLSGLLLSGAAFLMLGVVRLCGPGAIVDPENLLEEKNYFSSHLSLALWSAFCFLALALTCGALVAAKWPSETGFESATLSTWVQIFALLPRDQAATQGVPFPRIKLEVTLKNGLTYRGLLTDFTKDIGVADRELVLESPLSVVDVNGQERPLNTPKWHRLILPGSEVNNILVLYEGRRSPNTGPQQPSQSLSRWRTNPVASGYRSIQRGARGAYARRTSPQFLGMLLAAEAFVLVVLAALTRAF